MMNDKVQQKIKYYKTIPAGMLLGIENDYVYWAQGGASDVRTEYYPGEHDVFFQAVCDGMGWKWR
jgi:hypothetical protein